MRIRPASVEGGVFCFDKDVAALFSGSLLRELLKVVVAQSHRYSLLFRPENAFLMLFHRLSS
jgi:hypothetical protein